MADVLGRTSTANRRRVSRHGRHISFRRALLAALYFAAVTSCAPPDAVQVRLEASPRPMLTDPTMNVRAQLAGATSGLRYKWFAVAGECDPQQSDTAETHFSFAEGSIKDRITLEVWRGDVQVGHAEIDVKLDEERVQRALAARPVVEITITQIPPWQPSGGTDTRAEISGRVIGNRNPNDLLILYARADVWYRQPSPDAVIPIQPDGTWSSWTHTGASYAALLVRQDVQFFGRVDLLPVVGGLVLARTVVDGVKK
ncbi:MAG TPA: hypothetical protein VKA54_08515 [Gemmatimonadaceae bacterium]|nr:hypothetical protein [Gemmatimonadaceae bacterium]